MAADPTVSIYGARGLTGNGDVGTDDIATDAVTAAKLADDAVTGDTIANLGVNAGKLNLGAVSTALAIASAVVNEYHRANTTNTETVSRDIAYTDVGDVIACTGPITLTVPLDMTSSGSTGWRLGQFCFVECANASTVTLAAAGGVTLTARNGTVLAGAGTVGILLRVGTNSWRFVVIAGAIRSQEIDSTGLTTAQIDALWSTTPGDATIVSDPTNNLLLVRQAGSWRKVATTAV